ncbi:hypothetical protein BVC80_5385g2 [Macleaya cordata]|uniref:Protein kinase domain n=1 Tax=Macleaya cordata TaxID=56857 RepID=A0A200QA84_MACCD|nr:hypothetical protein BVC80_5385g2 [Macleaya cordata]
MRSIHIGVLCIQENVEDRPTMSSVVLMLNNHSLTAYSTIQSPSQPVFFAGSITGWSMVREELESSIFS